MTGFMDNWEKKDTTEAKEVNPPAEGGKPEPLAKQIFVQEGEYDPNLSIEEQELRDIEAAGGDGYSGAGGTPAEFPVKEEKKVTKETYEEEIETAKKKGIKVRDPRIGKKKAPSAQWLTKSANPAWEQIEAARAKNLISEKTYYVLMGIWGPPKSGKTGVVLDSLTEEEKKNGAEVHHYDFDLGGETTKSAHHEGDTNILVLNPWVMSSTAASRVPYDYPATFQNTMDYLRAAVEMAKGQLAYYNEHGEMPKPYLKTVVFDGADHWLHICETIMKVDDLKLGPDGIAVAGKDATTKIGRFNWNIRKSRYNSALTALQELCRLGVHCYIITHGKTAYDSGGNEIIGAETAHWLKDTEGWLQQVAKFEVTEERDEKGELTGVSESHAIITHNRTSLKSSGRVKVFRRDSEGGEWFGWKGLRDGSLDHADDVIDE